jgi:hypothetical protein
MVVAAPAGKPLDATLLSELKVAVFAAIQALSLDSDDDTASGTFSVVPGSADDIEETA